jgi:hypothetical protein
MSGLLFTIKPSPVLVEHRPLYKIAQLALILSIASRGNKSSLARLQLFNWALKDPDRIRFLDAGAESGELRIKGWGFDPAVPMALRYARADGLIDDIRTGYALTEAGEVFVRAFIDAGFLHSEYLVLSRVQKRITESMVRNVAQKWEVL